jgi:hypothetical protein
MSQIVLTQLVEAMEIQWVTNCTDLAGGSNVILAPILLTPVSGNHGISLVTDFTDTSWWKQWNFSGSQILLIPVDGSNGILLGHKFY